MTDRCRWDREAEAYMRDGEPCRTDDYGDPTHHCTGRNCANHIGADDLTCPRCVGRVRADIRAIVARVPELMPEAFVVGVNSQAATLAGPACDVEAWTWRKIAARQGRTWHTSLIEDDDERHPYTVTTRWVMMLAEDYGVDAPTMPRDLIGVERAAAFLERLLTKVAQDPEQEFALLAREIRRCRSHVEGVLRDSTSPERGAPCPDCDDQGHVVRMRREYPHWCVDPECERFHYSVMYDSVTEQIVPDTTGDWWICPRDESHNRPHAEYEDWIDARLEARRGASA